MMIASTKVNQARTAASSLDWGGAVLEPKPIWQAIAQKAQGALASYLNIPEDSLVFTRDTTEGLNMFLSSMPISSQRSFSECV